MSNNLFVYGMIRSGTTYLSKKLSQSKYIHISSDPLLQFFKCFQNEMRHKLNISNDKNYPIQDTIKLIDKNFEKFKSMPSDLRFNLFEKQEVLNLISQTAKRDSNRFAKEIIKTNPKNYKDLLSISLDLIKNIYDANYKLKYVGIKMTFCEQFFYMLNNHFPDSKHIFLIRDPLEVVKSNFNESNKRYFLLFLIRHWRKSYYLANEFNKRYDNVLLLNFNELIDKHWLEKISNFCKIKFSKDMFQNDLLLDDQNQKWSINSSYTNKRKVVELCDTEKNIIKSLTSVERISLGYESKNHKLNERAFLTYNEKRSQIYDWIYPYRDLFLCNEVNLISEKKVISEK